MRNKELNETILKIKYKKGFKIKPGPVEEFERFVAEKAHISPSQSMINSQNKSTLRFDESMLTSAIKIRQSNIKFDDSKKKTKRSSIHIKLQKALNPEAKVPKV